MMHDPFWLRFFMVAFFVGFGCWLFVKRTLFAGAGGLCTAELDEAECLRLTAASQRRERLERLPSSAIGLWLAAISFVMAALAAFTQIPLAVLYASNVLALAAAFGAAYLRLRKVQGPRFALLRERDARARGPAYAWLLTLLAVVLPLAWLPRLPAQSILVTLAGLSIVWLARCVAEMPALLTGEDVAVETFLDTRLRVMRVASLLAIAAAPAFVFESFSNYTDSTAHVATLFFTLSVWVLLGSRARRLVRGPSQAETVTWANAAQ
jgi:hypothetical protein